MEDPCRAWKAFAACALPLIPVLIRQMTAVTEQTEAAALNLMTTLQAIAQRTGTQTESAVPVIEAWGPVTGDRQEEQLQVPGILTNQQTNELSGEMWQIVTALQFQDITRQKLEHVEQALSRLRDHLQHLIDGRPDEEVRDSLSLLKELERSYTMEAERWIHGSANGGSSAAVPASTVPADNGDDSVTLF